MGKLTSVLKLKKKWKKMYIYILALFRVENKARKPSCWFLCDRNKRTFSNRGVALIVAPGRRGEARENSSRVGRWCADAFVLLETCLVSWVATQTHFRAARTAREQKLALQRENSSLFFGDKWCKSNSRCDVFSGFHVSDVVL